MSRTLAVLVAVTSALLPILPSGAQTAGMDAQLREQVARSVVQVQARGCPGGDRVGSGFAYGPAQHVVTAWHVVAGCNRITVYWEKHGGATQRANVVRVLSGADLALLHAVGAPGRALTEGRTRPKANDELEALGYYLAVPTMDNKPLRVTFGSTRLRDMLPKDVRLELEQSRAIDLNLDIVRLDGHLLPGLSGAPIFDWNGRVVAIGSGGLKSGSASVSWAVPAVHLTNLLTSSDSRTGGSGASSLFAAAMLDNDGAAAEAFNCGGVQFVYTGVRTFHELTLGHEHLQSIQYLVDEAELTDDDLASFRYHTYQPVNGGGAAAIPEWTILKHTGNTTCQALALNNQFSVDFSGQEVSSLNEAQQVSMRYGDQYVAWSQRVWQPFQEYSYIGPIERDDGMLANRATYVSEGTDGTASFLARTFLLHQPPNTERATFTGIIGTYWNFNLEWVNYCEEYSHDPRCKPHQDEEKMAAQLMLGIFLATAPLI
jgi:S1-C subfamily serine protease